MFSQLTPVTKAIILINAAVFIFVSILNPEWEIYLAAYYPQSRNFQLYQIITHMFMHGSLMHILFNMFTLLSFGPVLERVLGQKKFLIFYFICGLGAFAIFNAYNYLEIHKLTQNIIDSNINPAAIFQKADITMVKDPATNNYFVSLNEDGQKLFMSLLGQMVGASGAIFGVIAAFSILYPDAKLIFLFIPFPVKAKYLLPAIIGISLFLGFRQFEGDNIAHFAHIGGAVVGAVYIYFWKKDKYRIT